MNFPVGVLDGPCDFLRRLQVLSLCDESGINTYKLNSSGEERMIENGLSHVEAKLGPLPGIVFTNTQVPRIIRTL